MRRKVGDVMTTVVVAASPDTPCKQLVQLLAERRVSAVPVVDRRGHVLGVESEVHAGCDADVAGQALLRSSVDGKDCQVPVPPACRGDGRWRRGEGASGLLRADAQGRRSDTADQAAARHAYPVATAPATGANSPATGTIVPSLPTTMVGA
jgi:hypothetical protein